MEKEQGITHAYFEDEIKTSYLNYAYSVITGRAIPDVRDGMKPVQRRILYVMSELALWHDKPTRKSARIVGDVLGKYHPHGDSSVYMAMVKMAQEFHMRYPLVIGQGNFGSIDDDPPAAMRYTEAKLSRVAEFMLEDLDKDTVDFKPNFDDTLKEPKVLPGRFPNLLCNGTTGIAVGLATDIPPHNFREVASAIKATLANPGISVQELVKLVPGPDFPTGGVILNKEEMISLYQYGHGSVDLAGTIIYEEKGGRGALVITEIPYRVVKSSLIEEITNLYLNNTKYANILRGIKEIRDESSKEGIRIVIDLHKDANVESIKTVLFQQTALRTRIKVNMVALVDNQPRVLGLKDLLQQYIDYRRLVITRRTQFELDKAEKRLHIVEGLLIALDAIDEVIHTIRTSRDTAAAKEALMKRFKLTEVQAEAILDMKLQKLTNLEVHKLQEEKDNLKALIKELKEILEKPAKRDALIGKELDEMLEALGDDRRTRFEVISTAKIDVEELIEDEPMILMLTHKGFLVRETGRNFKVGTRGARGKKGDITDMNRLEADDYIIATVSGNLKDSYLFVTDSGRVYSVKGYEITGATEGRITRTYIKNIARLEEIEKKNERVTAVLAVKEFSEENFILFLTKKGRMARIMLSDFANITRAGIIGIKLRVDDHVVDAMVTDGNAKLFIVKNNAKGFRCRESLFPVHNRGVGGEKATSVISSEDEVMGMAIADETMDVIFVSRDGRGRRVNPKEFSELVNRGGKGFKLVDLGKNRTLAGFTLVEPQDRVMIITRQGSRIVFPQSEVSTNLLKLIDLRPGDEVLSVTTIPGGEE
ncbi:DNA gyrase/topoisomerase IV subunit A [Thermospira aquatica]|uniref:DNA topoisomerase (ATP-hydrolyzing) n=1 Tax=Thermospira aquatica TaxID=2828656 RepID=A0AAX3BGY0_9SPIR|nr:DNA topoisomerase (ATP-hydrolyzing) [Thermospira aquatica]URA10711.1 DNA topoisomerase 4 subunit A [Thermospira aquatica]